MKPGPKPSEVEKVGYKVYIPKTLMAEIRLILLDPLRGKIQHGALTTLVEDLLFKWVMEQRKKMPTPQPQAQSPSLELPAFLRRVE